MPLAQPSQTMNVKLQVTNHGDPHPTRSFALKPPSYSIQVGRGSKSGSKELSPASHNSWFESRVMSRDHAVFKADPETKLLYVQDVGSMHGTFVEDRKIKSNEKEALIDGDHVRFGTEVMRGPGESLDTSCEQTINWLPLGVTEDVLRNWSDSRPLPESFPPLEVVVSSEWSKDIWTPLTNAPKLLHAELSRNTFVVPDDDDEEEEDDDEVEIIRESVCVHDVDVVSPSRTFAVPESDFSCAGSFTSEDAPSEPLTPETSRLIPSSSPVSGPSGLSESEKRADEKAMALHESSPTMALKNPMAKACSAFELFRAVNDDNANSKTQGDSPVLDTSKNLQSAVGTRSVDIDLTESESDSEDRYSDDLWVEDSELEGGEKDEEPSQSYYDEDADEVGNRGQKLRRAGEVDPVQNDSNGNLRISDTANMESYNTTSDFPDSQTHCPCAAASVDRAPSPSDAAMAKAPASGNFPSSSPFINFSQPARPFITSVNGYNLPSMDGAEWPSRPIVWDTLVKYPPQMSAQLPHTVFTPPAVSDGTYQYPYDYPAPYQFVQPKKLSDLITNRKDESTPAGQPDTSGTVTKVCLQRIAGDTQAGEHSSGQTLKRKADDISGGAEDKIEPDATHSSHTVTISELTTTDAQPDSLEDTVRATAVVSQARIVTSVKSDTVACKETQKTDERPKKRAKTGGRSLMKSMGLVMVGTVIGAVGTVAGLVALPPDFFV